MPARKATLTSTMANFFGRHTKPEEPMSPSHLSPPVPSVPAKYSKQHASSATYLATTSLLGKVAIVTGSSRSTGAAIARCLGEHGAHVVVNYLTDLPAAEEVVRHIRSQGKGGAIAVQADAASMEGGQRLIDETMRTFGRIDILVMNSGLMGSKTLNDLDEPFFDNMFLTNVKAPLFFVKKAAPLLSAPGGRIIFFSSSLTSASSLTPSALCYVATKGAIEQIARVLSKDLGTRGITVNTVSPGPMDTPHFREGKSPSVLDAIAKQTPSKRMGEPDDIAPIVAFLASDAAGWVNGQNLRANGGFVV